MVNYTEDIIALGFIKQGRRWFGTSSVHTGRGNRVLRRSRALERILAGGNGRFFSGPEAVSDHERDDQHNPPPGFSHSGHGTTVHQHGVEKFRRGRQRGHSREQTKTRTNK